MPKTVYNLDDYFVPFDRQKEAWLATYTHRYVLYGGARGGGKSKFLRWWLLDFLIYHFNVYGLRNVRVMLACETYRDLADRQLTKIRTEFPPWLGRMKETKEDGLAFFLNPSLGGGIIALRNLDEPEKYQSAEFAAIGVDELTKNPLSVFNILRGSLRWVGIPHTVFLGTTNPGGVGHGWVKSYWIDKVFPKELRDKADEFIFIPSLPADNPNLDKTYWDELNSLPPELAKAWVEGRWDMFSGQAFPTFSRADHVIMPVAPEETWTKMRGIDWGKANPWCCLWGMKDPLTGRVIIYRELYEKELADNIQARKIVDNTTLDERISVSYADPALWQRKEVKGIISSTADEYRDNGVVLTRGDNDRLSGKRKIDRLLMDLPDGRPGLLITSDCPNLIREMENLVYSKSRPEDVDTEGSDHAYDALRYLLSGVTSVYEGSYRKPVQHSPMFGLKGI